MELDSHSNVFVLGSNYFVFKSTGRTCNCQPFSSDLSMAKDVPFVDGALGHDCTHTRKVHVLVIRNALHVTSKYHNLIKPFIMRAGVIIVNDVSKIHGEDPIVDDHSVSFDQSKLRITLRLNGMFHGFNRNLLLKENCMIVRRCS